MYDLTARTSHIEGNALQESISIRARVFSGSAQNSSWNLDQKNDQPDKERSYPPRFPLKPLKSSAAEKFWSSPMSHL